MAGDRPESILAWSDDLADFQASPFARLDMPDPTRVLDLVRAATGIRLTADQVTAYERARAFLGYAGPDLEADPRLQFYAAGVPDPAASPAAAPTPGPATPRPTPRPGTGPNPFDIGD